MKRNVLLRQTLCLMSALLLTMVAGLSSCDKPVELIMAESIELITEGDLIMGENGSEEIEFAVTPADATFNYDTESEDCQIMVRTGTATSGKGLNYTLTGVAPVEGKKGHYIAVLTDKGTGKKYDDKVVIDITAAGPDGQMYTVVSPKFRVRYETWPLFTKFSFLKEDNQTAVYEDIELDVTSGSARISSPLISSPLLVASFDHNDAKVYVDGVEQVSGETVNDFSKPVTYIVKSKNEYRFTIEVTYSGLPVVFVETPGKQQVPSKHEDWLAGTTLKIYNPDWSVDFEGTTGMRGRGNSTWSYPKKPYAFKLDDKAEILGMPKHKRWVLLANWMDRTIMRNSVSFNLAARTGLAYTPRGQFVELYLNGEHKGNYFLCEQIKVDKNRVNVDELDEGEVDGGYIMELDSYYDEVNKFKSSRKSLPYMFKDPDEVDSQQFAYIRNYVNNLEDALYDNARFAAGEYRDYIDVDSFVDWWIVMELTGIWEPNHPKSTYMHKDKGGKLTMGPVWDFDWETYMPGNQNQYRIKTSLYYSRLFEDPYFVSKVKERWNMFEAEFRSLPQFIESEAERLAGSESMNHAMWPITNVVNLDESLSFEAAVERMISAYEAKLNWMDNKIGSM